MRQSRRRARAAALLGALILALTAIGCQAGEAASPPGIFDVPSANNCVPAAGFIDQKGQPVNFASLKGKWLVVDFIYTNCPGPCELMTSRLAMVADQLGGRLGNQIEFVSVSLDPAHDSPKVLTAWARAQDADRPGWLFLTGPLPSLNAVMSAFHVQRRVEANGMIDHVIELFLVGPDGHQKRLYNPNEATPAAVAHDLVHLAT